MAKDCLRMISMRMENHAQKAGYDRCLEGLDDAPILVGAMDSLLARAIGFIGRPIFKRSGNTWYHRESFWGEVQVAAQWLRSRGHVYHYLYGENLFRYGGHLRSLSAKNRLAATYHAPAWRMAELIAKPSHIRRLDAAVVMSNSQRSFFAPYLADEQVHFIPHGIDTDFFRPPEARERANQPLRLLTVGFHLRDFDVLKQVATNLQGRDDVTFHVVCAPDRAAQLSGLTNVTTESGIDDDVLLSRYQAADALFLPLIDATANNTLLEGLACGLPVLSTDIEGVRDYTSSSCARLAPKGDSDAHTSLVEWALAQQAELPEMAAASRQKAQDFSWARVRAQLSELYDSLA